MKKLTLVGLGIFTFSALTLGAQGVSADAVQPKATSEASVLFEADDDGEDKPPVVVPPTGEGEEGAVDGGGSDGNTGDGLPSFNISWVSNFRFNDRADADTDFTQFKPIKLNANGMKLWAKGTQLTLNKLGEDGVVLEPKVQTVYKNIPNFVQVVDNRGKNSGWHVSVEAGDFKGMDAENEITLTGAEISLHDATLKGPSGITAPTTFADSVTLNTSAKNLMSAGIGAGTGSWSLKFGQEEAGSNGYETLKANTGVLLNVPAQAQAKAGVAYKAQLKWILTDGPAS